MTPYAAPTPSTFSTAALSGTSTERNTSISTMNDRPITAPRNHGIRCCSRDDDVVTSGGRAGDRHLDVGAVHGRGDDVLAEALEQLVGAARPAEPSWASPR